MMTTIFDWIDTRTGLISGIKDACNTPIPRGAGWKHVWPSTIAFAFIVQAISGLFLWMLYSPGAQTAWESVYFIQFEVQGGWLLRAIHHTTGQVLLILVIIYAVQMVFTGMYRAPREILFWILLAMGCLLLGSLLTGDLLRWDENGYSCTKVRTNFLMLIPFIGGELNKLAIGGPDFGHLTLTQFTALHVAILGGGFLVLLTAYAWIVKRVSVKMVADEPNQKFEAYWPNQALKDSIACVVVAVIIAVVSIVHETTLGAPADPGDFFDAARPEWAFLGLYQFVNMFPADMKFVAIYVITTLAFVVLFLMPFIAYVKVGHWFNVAFTTALLIAMGILSYQCVAHDLDNETHLAALEAGKAKADRVFELIKSPRGIPVSGALTLLRDDSKTQGPKLFKQHCASCHDHVDADGKGIKAETVSAPNLYGYVTRDWVVGWMDPKRIVSPDYLGKTKFKRSDMVDSIKENFSDMEKEDIEDRMTAAIALSAEAKLPSQLAMDKKDAGQIKEGMGLLTDDFGCADCHRIGKKGKLGSATDLTGYGSREWTIGIISNPAHKRFYGKENDRMPAYAESTDNPANNILSAKDIELITDWLRSDWYEPEK